MPGWDFRICGYATPNYSRDIGVPVGAKLCETTHKGESSAYVEIEAWKERMRRGEVGHVELIDLRLGGNLTNLHVRPETDIKWSWR